MNTKFFSSLFLGFGLAFGMVAHAQSFSYDSLYAGTVKVVNADMELPDFARWHYFSFDENEGVIVRGTSDFVLENLNPGKVGTEKIDSTWQLREDWDIAFHAYDTRTNSGLAGLGNAGAIFIADSLSAAATSSTLEQIYDRLTAAPDVSYPADTLVSGTFYLSLAQMPPQRATTLSLCKATRADTVKGASADFATLSMSGGSIENPMIVVLKTTTGKYVKIFLKQFVENGKPGFLKFDYAFIPLEDETDIRNLSTQKGSVSLYPNPVTDFLQVNLTEASEIAVYNLAGNLVHQQHVAAGTCAIPVSHWAKGMYIVRIHTAQTRDIKKIVIN
ncbi:MAG: T9SS type A sorting domain-containing protein [Bacteroidales bacterium]|jgi:hypothetical protein|nr:T9SS type A sorting domain-containing protein [Bacteroidales bacterium]